MKKVSSTNSISLAVILFALTAFSGQLFANNMNVTNVTYNQAGSIVTFTISWDNSWHNTSSAPNNWDAAWVFVKWRDCNALNSFDFTHGLIDVNAANSNFNVGGTGTTFTPSKRDGTLGQIDASTHNTGVMLVNSANGASASGTVSSTITLHIAGYVGNINGGIPAGTLDMRVFAIEMTFIPQGPFIPGDCNAGVCSNYSFSSSQGNFSAAPAITSENQVIMYESTNNSSFSVCYNTGGCTVLAGFPKGYNAFYMMKYEITQGQYIDFLNSTFLAAQLARYPGNTANSRNTITNTNNAPNIYAAARPDRGCNFLSWDDVAAYLDWAALRPCTELEYEKACRGGTNSTANPTVIYEMAWGTASGRAAQTLSGTENGTETVTDFGANVTANLGNTYGNSDLTPAASGGPLRVGIYATSTSNTRIQTGAGYYGNMDLSGNVAEFYITVYSGTSGQPSTSGVSDGNGILTAAGLHNITNWPSTSVSGKIMLRGGSFANGSNGGIVSGSQNLNVSWRHYLNTAYTDWFNFNSFNRDNRAGGRGGR